MTVTALAEKAYYKIKSTYINIFLVLTLLDKPGKNQGTWTNIDIHYWSKVVERLNVSSFSDLNLFSFCNQTPHMWSKYRLSAFIKGNSYWFHHVVISCLPVSLRYRPWTAH